MAIASVLLLEAGCISILLIGDLGIRVPAFLMAYVVAFAGYLLAVRSLDGLSFTTVIVCGIAFRLTVIAIAPTLSDDIYRYLWDGLVQLQGFNPYQYPPGAEELSVVLRPDILQHVNHPHLPTIYPPFAQFFFRLCAWVAPEVWAIKSGIVIWDCVAVFFFVEHETAYDIEPAAVALYFWNPLVILEGAGQGHIDIVAISLLISALLYLRIGGYGRSAAALALSGLTKLLPIFLLPAFWRWAARGEADGRSVLRAMFTTRAVVVPVVFGLVFVGGYIPFLDVGWQILGSLGTYASSWEFNAPIYGLLRELGLGGQTSRLLLAVGFLATACAVSVRPIPAIQAAYYLLGMFLILTPTLHPWYVVWIVPFLCFYGNRGWLTMSGLVVLAYLVLVGFRETGVWEEEGWVRWLIFIGSGMVRVAPRLLNAIKGKGGPPAGDPLGQTHVPISKR